MRGLTSMPGRGPTEAPGIRRPGVAGLRHVPLGAIGGRSRQSIVGPAPIGLVSRREGLLGRPAHDQRLAGPSLIRPSDVAKDLAVSRTWVYEAANAGRIPSIRIGGEDGPLRFVPEDLDRWIDEAREAWRPGGRSVATRNPVGDRPLDD
jgi:excisionase family DNA binding protein